jgi:hypothetical protein
MARRDPDAADDPTATDEHATAELASHMARPDANGRRPHTDDAPDASTSPASPPLRLAPSAAGDDPGRTPTPTGDPTPSPNHLVRNRSNGERVNGTGERPAIRPYTYRRPRPDARRVLGVALAVVMVLGVSLAVVAFTQGSSGSPTAGRDRATSVPPDGGSTTTGAAGGAPSTEPGRSGDPGSTAVPTTVAPPTSAPQSADDAGDTTGDRAGAPVIGRFAATEQGLGTPCGAAQRRITLAWESTGATSAQLDGPGAPTEALPPSGEATACRDSGPPETYTLTVTGPGGTSFRTTTA